MTTAILLAFGAGMLAGYILAFAYIRIRDGRHSELKTREPCLDRLDPTTPG